MQNARFSEWQEAFVKWKERVTNEPCDMEKEGIPNTAEYMAQAKKMGFTRSPPFGVSTLIFDLSFFLCRVCCGPNVW